MLKVKCNSEKSCFGKTKVYNENKSCAKRMSFMDEGSHSPDVTFSGCSVFPIDSAAAV